MQGGVTITTGKAAVDPTTPPAGASGIRCRDEARSSYQNIAAAVTSAGLKRSGPLTNADVQLVHWYLGNMSAVVVGAGVPESVLLT
eukprot:COSAG04_NODE_24247_length_324_cov_1.368889_1_plen_85_part_01